MSTNRKHPSKDYAIGYKKPPVHTRFAKGKSGNPKGRPKCSKKITEMFQEELLRTLKLKEGDRVIQMPAIQAVARSYLNYALKGNGPALRGVINLAQTLPHDEPTSAPDPSAKLRILDPKERARRVAFMLERAARKMKKGEP